MQKIVPQLWFDKEAKEAADFYVSVFREGKLKSQSVLKDTPSGDVDVVSIELFGYEIGMISAGPYFKINPSISFTVVCDTKEEVSEYWDKLVDGGIALMELDKYPFSEWYGWVKDKYGLTWQLICWPDLKSEQRVIPALMFIHQNTGKAEEAMEFYTSVFKDSKMGEIWRYKGDEGVGDKEGTVAHGDFILEGQFFQALDSAYDHKFDFNEAISFLVRCEDQAEVDYYWEKLSAVPEAEQCGWLKDKYGVSWQIAPKVLDEMMASGDTEAVARVTKAFLQMKKFDVEELKKAYE